MPATEKKAPAIDVRYVADLARIELTDEEAERYGQQLQDIIAYVDKLQELSVEGIEPTAHAMPLHNVLREDRVEPSLSREVMLANAPAVSRDQFVQVPAVIEEGDA